MNLIVNTSYSWLPPTVLAAILLISIIIGHINGWKTALYFMGWNLLGMIIGFVIINYFYENVIAKLNDSTTTFNFQKILFENESIAKPIVGLIITLSILLIINFIAFLIYWIFRTSLKRTIREDKKARKSLFITRLSGSLVSFVTAIPIALFSSSLATTFSKQNSFTNWNSTMVKFISIGKFSNVNQNINDIVNLLKASKELQNFKDDFSQIFKNKTKISSASIAVLNEEKNVQTLTKILNSPIISNSLNTLLSSIIKIDKSKMDFIGKNIHKIFSVSLVTSLDQQKKLTEQVVKYFKDTPAANATSNNVRNYFKIIKLFS